MPPLLEINITYDGIYPNLCTGTLTIEINKHVWIFPNSPLISGGSYSFDSEWNSFITEGLWDIEEWPKDFPEEYKEATLEKINDAIRHGCCGGCL